MRNRLQGATESEVKVNGWPAQTGCYLLVPSLAAQTYESRQLFVLGKLDSVIY